MTRGIKSVVFGAVVAAVAFAVPTVAKADRWDHDRHDWHDHDRGGHLNVDVRVGGESYERPPVVVDRAQQVWVEPVYQTVCEKVWVEPVVEKRTDRVWVPDTRVLQDVRRGNHIAREWVITPAHYEDRCQDVVVSPGHWEDVQKQVLVSDGHWETRVDRVAVAPPPAHDGVRFDLKLPIHW